MVRTPSERGYEYAILDGIRNYFKRRGFSLQWGLLTSHEENSIPADILLNADTKIFGLQVKRVYIDSHGVYYIFTRDQHNKITNNFKDLITYALPTFTESIYFKTAEHHTIFLPVFRSGHPSFGTNNQAKVYFGNIKIYTRWGKLMERLDNCPFGKKISEILKIKERFFDILDTEQFSIYFFVISKAKNQVFWLHSEDIQEDDLNSLKNNKF